MHKKIQRYRQLCKESATPVEEPPPFTIVIKDEPPETPPPMPPVNLMNVNHEEQKVFIPPQQATTSFQNRQPTFTPWQPWAIPPQPPAKVNDCMPFRQDASQREFKCLHCPKIFYARSYNRFKRSIFLFLHMTAEHPNELNSQMGNVKVEPGLIPASPITIKIESIDSFQEMASQPGTSENNRLFPYYPFKTEPLSRDPTPQPFGIPAFELLGKQSPKMNNNIHDQFPFKTEPLSRDPTPQPFGIPAFELIGKQSPKINNSIHYQFPCKPEPLGMNSAPKPYFMPVSEQIPRQPPKRNNTQYQFHGKREPLAMDPTQKPYLIPAFEQMARQPLTRENTIQYNQMPCKIEPLATCPTLKPYYMPAVDHNYCKRPRRGPLGQQQSTVISALPPSVAAGRESQFPTLKKRKSLPKLSFKCEHCSQIFYATSHESFKKSVQLFLHLKRYHHFLFPGQAFVDASNIKTDEG